MINAFSFPRRRPAAIAAGALALAALAATPAAAAECKTKFLVGTWAYTDYVDDPDIQFTNVLVCTAQFNEKGQTMDGACSFLPKGQKVAGLEAHLSVSKACAVTGRLTFVGRKGRPFNKSEVTGTLDPKKGILTIKPKRPLFFDEAKFFQQW